MTEKIRKQLGDPINDLERDTLNYIEPLITEMIGEDILGKGLTLKGCLESCFKKGKQFEIKSGNSGCARITEEQHFAWVREYFGIEKAATPTAKADTSENSGSAKKPTRLELDLDDLFD